MQGPGLDISSLMGGIMMPPPPPMNTTQGSRMPDFEEDDDLSDIISISGDSTGGEVKEVNVDGLLNPRGLDEKRRLKLISKYI